MPLRLRSGALLLAVLLLIGLAVGRLVWEPLEPFAGTTFRVWWWEHRVGDLAAQVGLIFAGALGIAALLPPEEEGGG